MKKVQWEKVYNPSTCKSILDLSNGNMFIFRGTMGEFVEQQPPLSTSGVWFDYCGTISGNKLMCPLDDIRTAIRRQIFVRNGGIAAFTFSTRDSKRNTRLLQNDVLKMFIRRYPKSKIVDMFRYHPSMLFFMIRVWNPVLSYTTPNFQQIKKNSILLPMPVPRWWLLSYMFSVIYKTFYDRKVTFGMCEPRFIFMKKENIHQTFNTYSK